MEKLAKYASIAYSEYIAIFFISALVAGIYTRAGLAAWREHGWHRDAELMFGIALAFGFHAVDYLYWFVAREAGLYPVMGKLWPAIMLIKSGILLGAFLHLRVWVETTTLPVTMPRLVGAFFMIWYLAYLLVY